MPHKRAKRSVREKERAERGHDLAPSKSQLSRSHLKEEAIPKSAARVLNALKIREEYKKRKRENGDDNDEGDASGRQAKKRKKGKDKGTVGEDKKEKVGGILPGESLEHYNKRVEQNMRPLVRDAVKTSLAVSRGTKKRDEAEKAAKKTKKKTQGDEDDDLQPPRIHNKHAAKAKEFETLSTSAPKRLNDIVQAPPEMPRLRASEKALGRTGGNIGKSGGVISMAQKAMMEEEREKAIKRYRDMKAKAREQKEADS